LNRLIYYPTGGYGTFVQWLCNTVNISGSQDLPFHTDGNSHQYVLTDQYRLLISEQDDQEFVATLNPNVVSCIWPVEHNGRMFNANNEWDFYFKLSCYHLAYFDQANVKILVIHPTETSKIWWWHNNCKKVFYTLGMFDKKIKNRAWYKALTQNFQCADAGQFTPGQLRTVMAHSIANESFDYLGHWQRLPEHFPNIKFVSLDQLRDHTKDTIQGILEYFNVESNLPLDFVLDQWTPLQTTRNRDAEHSKIVNCIVNGQPCDWSDLNFDLFDEVYLYHELKYQHNIMLDADNLDSLPTNTHDLLLLR
jgi:hypothetical protein